MRNSISRVFLIARSAFLMPSQRLENEMLLETRLLGFYTVAPELIPYACPVLALERAFMRLKALLILSIRPR